MGYEIGDTLPEILTPVIDRLRIAYMTVAMRDPNPVHVEPDYAAKAGLPSVIAHGTFGVAYLGAVVARAAGVEALIRLKVDLVAPVFPGEALRTDAVVTDVAVGERGTVVSLQLTATTTEGKPVARGTAEFQDPVSS